MFFILVLGPTQFPDKRLFVRLKDTPLLTLLGVFTTFTCKGLFNTDLSDVGTNFVCQSFLRSPSSPPSSWDLHLTGTTTHR